MKIKEKLYYFNHFFIILLIPSFITGLFLPNLLCFFFILINLFLNFKKIENFFRKNIRVVTLFSFFYFFLILSSLFSNYTSHALEASFLYFFFIVFVASLVLLFEKDKKFLIYFLISGSFSVFFLSIDAFYELYNGQNIFGFKSIDGRIAGLFGNRWLIGRFTIYVIPILLSIYFLEYDNLNKISKIFITFSIIMAIFTVTLSGERAAFILLIILFFFTFIFFINKIYFRYLFFIFLIISATIILPFLITDTSARLKSNFILYLTNYDLDKNQYLSMWITSIKMFFDNPFFGIGPNNFRLNCSELSYYVSKWSCSTHPHNITLQLLAEIGLVGFIFVYSVFIFFIIKIYNFIFNNVLTLNLLGLFYICLSVVLYLFPLMITGNFFLSWYGFIFYIPISLYYVYK